MSEERATILPPPPPLWIALRALFARVKVRFAIALRCFLERVVERAEASAESLGEQLFERPSAALVTSVSRADRPTAIEVRRAR